MILLVAPWVATLWTASYNKATPTMGGFPFFYWYQLMWIPLSVVTTGIAYLLVRRLQREREAGTGESEGGK
jgi:hypothetical protein